MLRPPTDLLRTTRNCWGRRTVNFQGSCRFALFLLIVICAQACADGPRESSDSTENSEDTSNSSTGGTVSGSSGGGELSSTGGAGGGTTGGTGGGTTGGGATGSAGQPATDPPVLPISIRIEEAAVGFCGVDGVVESTNAGFSGSGYANSDNAIGAGVSWLIQIREGGPYSFGFPYANGSADDRPADLSVDGARVSSGLSFPATSAWTTWSSTTVDISLQAGTHAIALSATSAAGLANIDRLEVEGAAVEPADCYLDAGTGGETGTGGSGTGDSGPLPNIDVYIAGDSTVSTYADTASPSDQAGWGQMLREIFDERVIVTNRAVGGRTALWFHLEGGTQWILDRIQPGDYWFVQFGTNDSHPTATFEVDGVTYPRLAEANGAFKVHLKDYYLDPAREKNAIPVFVTPPPRNSAYCGNGNSLGGYARAMRDLAEEEDVLVLDLNQRTFDHLAAICPSPMPENFFFVRPDSTVDGTHFQENGARHMARFLGDEMLARHAGPYQYVIP